MSFLALIIMCMYTGCLYKGWRLSGVDSCYWVGTLCNLYCWDISFTVWSCSDYLHTISIQVRILHLQLYYHVLIYVMMTHHWCPPSAFHRKLRERDASKFHIQLSIALFCMLLVFVVGIDQTAVYGGCVTVSVLIHYFTLVMWMWMGAEAVLMFQKLIIVFVRITTRYIIAISFICWCKFLD